eukprot:6315955-Pyramimonas_sp.AAC.1
MDNSQLWHFFGVRNDLGGELNSPVVDWLNRGLMDNSQLWHFFGANNDLGGELNSPVVEWVKKGSMSASSPSI